MNISLAGKHFVLMVLLFTVANAQKAFVIVPVANAVGQAFARSNDHFQEYHEIPASWGPSQKDKGLCARMHQLVFNEVVRTIEYKGDQVLIELPSMFYDHQDTKQPCNRLWIHKKYILSFDLIPSYQRKLIPYSFGSTPQDQLIATLQLPFYDSVTNRTYSAGTRFVVDQINDNSYTVWVYDLRSQEPERTLLPQELCAQLVYKNTDEQIESFVHLAKLWANWRQGDIPMVWGGNSLINFYRNFHYSLKMTQREDGSPGHYWVINNQQIPLAGFDSSGFILRAAQICGIPYFYKNTTTARAGMTEVTSFKELQNGDLLWIPGALFVITDRQKGTLAGCLGYQYGYGKLFETHISDLIEGIQSFKDLCQALKKNQQLMIINPQSHQSRPVNDGAFLSMKSLFKN